MRVYCEDEPQTNDLSVLRWSCTNMTRERIALPLKGNSKGGRILEGGFYFESIRLRSELFLTTPLDSTFASITLFPIYSSGFQVMIPPRKCDAVVWLTKIKKTKQEIIEDAIALIDTTTAAATDWLRALAEVSIYSICFSGRATSMGFQESSYSWRQKSKTWCSRNN